MSSIVFDESEIAEATAQLRGGGVIAYPTEAVYGLGCDPFNLPAITRLLNIKKRSINKGFILVAADFEQLQPLIEPIEPVLLTRVLSSWPGPNTWVFPAQPGLPRHIRGDHKTIAVRISAHPIVQALCQQFGAPIISTSANITGGSPARSYRTTELLFGNQLDFIVHGETDSNQNPSVIRDALTGEIIRA